MNTRDLQSQREAFYERIDPHHMAPLWTRLKSLVPEEPTPVGVAHHWRYADVRPYVLESAQHITAKEAERRVLILENPGLRAPRRSRARFMRACSSSCRGKSPPHIATRSPRFASSSRDTAPTPRSRARRRSWSRATS